MNPNYRKLNLTVSPLKITDLTPYYSEWRYPWHCSLDVENILSDELLQIFKDLSVRPTMVVFFDDARQTRLFEHCTPHSDIAIRDKKWQTLPCGINWELNNEITSTVTWFDTSGVEPLIYDINDPIHKLYPFKHIDGIRYLDNLPTIETLTIKKPENQFPALYRTDICHNVCYTTSEARRTSISVRFHHEDIPDWETAIAKFAPLFSTEPYIHENTHPGSLDVRQYTEHLPIELQEGYDKLSFIQLLWREISTTYSGTPDLKQKFRRLWSILFK